MNASDGDSRKVPGSSKPTFRIHSNRDRGSRGGGGGGTRSRSPSPAPIVRVRSLTASSASSYARQTSAAESEKHSPKTDKQAPSSDWYVEPELTKPSHKRKPSTEGPLGVVALGAGRSRSLSDHQKSKSAGAITSIPPPPAGNPPPSGNYGQPRPQSSTPPVSLTRQKSPRPQSSTPPVSLTRQKSPRGSGSPAFTRSKSPVRSSKRRGAARATKSTKPPPPTASAGERYSKRNSNSTSSSSSRGKSPTPSSKKKRDREKKKYRMFSKKVGE